MNLSNYVSQQSGLLFVNFNQDCTSLVVGTKTGYEILNLNCLEKIPSIYKSPSQNSGNSSDDVCIIERLFSSSLLALVNLSSPRKLRVFHFRINNEICSYSYANSILSVKLNRQRLVVCLEESLYIHNTHNMKVLHTIRDTPSNPEGLIALSCGGTSYLAYPGSNMIGEVLIFDTIQIENVTMIPAHDNPLAAMSFNSLGNRLATASVKGTVIRVFSIPEGGKLFDFRRGVKRCAQITSVAFCPNSVYLACSSLHETVHIFKLQKETDVKPREEENQGWMDYLNQALKTSATYLPTQVTQVADVFTQGRDFATARLPVSGLKTICGIAHIENRLMVLVACQDACLYMYTLDTKEGGECALVKCHRLDGSSEESLSPKLPSQPATGTSCSGKTDPSNSPASQQQHPPRTSPTPSEPKPSQFYSPAAGAGLNAIGQLRLDDHNEFPPMKSE